MIPANKSFADVIVEPFDNQAIESEENVGLSSGSVTTDDNEPVVSIAEVDSDANEAAGNPGMLRINLTEPRP